MATPAARSQLQFSAILRALRHRNYRLFIGGQLISVIGTWMQSVAQAWLVYRITGSAAILGMVGFASQIPVFLLSPLGGVVADRTNRHHIVVGTQTASMVLALILAGLTLSEKIQVWQVVVLSASLGCVNAFDIPARQAFIAEMVGREDLMNAIALNSSMFNSARIIGPAVAGILVAAVGEGWCFFINGVSYIAVIAGLLLMRLSPRSERSSTRSAFEDIVEGFRFVIHAGPIHSLLLLLGVVSIVAMPYAVLMPIFADQILHGGARGLGLLMGFSGIGALAGALILAARRGVRGLSLWVAVSCAGLGVSLIFFSMSRIFWLSAVLLIPAGFAMMVQMASSNTLIQTMAPNALRGRVMSVYSMMFMGMAPVGALLAGLAASRFGAPLTVACGGVISIAGALTFRLHWRTIRCEARQLIVAQQMAGGDPPDEVTDSRPQPAAQ